jgi:hypothetical protein
MGDTIGVLVDMNERRVSFFKNQTLFFCNAALIKGDGEIRIALSTLYEKDEFQIIYHPYPQFPTDSLRGDAQTYLKGVNQWYNKFAGVTK